MVSFKKSVLVALLMVSGLSFTGCATTGMSSESDKLHAEKTMRVVDRADGHYSHRETQ